MPKKPAKYIRQPITDVLFLWLHKQRLIAAVAREMGVNESTLSAELRPKLPLAKLGANQLVPLFDAIRRLGYGDQLDGILSRYIAELKGEQADVTPLDSDLTPYILALYRGLGAFPAGDTPLSGVKDRAELAGLSVLLQTEILPMVLRMQAMVSARLEAVPAKKKMKRAKSA